MVGFPTMSDAHDRERAELEAFGLLETHADFTDPDGSSGMEGVRARDPETQRSLEQQLEGLRILEHILHPRPEPASPAPIAPKVSVPDDAPRIGRYRILGVVGRGGMGVVYRAAPEGIDREVALKVLPPHCGLSAEAVARFKREAQLASSLNHPGIVHVLDVDCDGDTWFYTMDLVEGQNLQAVLEVLGQPGAGYLEQVDVGLLGVRPPEDIPEPSKPATRYVIHVAHLVSRVARALAHAHEKGILHRDLKPANIMLNGAGNPVITDFGLATSIEVADRTRTTMGTLDYLPPEIIEGGSCPSPAQDIYSLGAVLYHLLTLSPPFEGDSDANLMTAIRSGEVVPPSRRNPAVGRDLEAIVLKAMHVDALSRFDSAAEMARDLERFVRDETVGIQPPPFRARLLRRIRRNPWKAVAIGLAIIAVGQAVAMLFLLL
jgi:serine/threonine protein kinase